MKPLWKGKPKKKPKKKAPSRRPVRSPRPKPEPWVPPHLESLPKKSPKIQLTKEFAKNDQVDVESKVTPKTTTKQDAGVRTEFNKIFRELCHAHRPIDVWTDFVTMFACAISNSVDKSNYDKREQRYLRIIRKYKKDEQSLFPKLAALTVESLEENPEQDFLGHAYTMLGLADKSKEQIFTPYHIADLMARIAMGDDLSAQVQQRGFIEVDDPCCGGGVTLIAAINEARRQLGEAGLNFQDHILVSGQDIDEIVTMMCYIQISLLGVAGYFKVGNSLTEPMANGDRTENYWFTPMYCCSPIWHYRRIFQKINQLTKEVEEDGH